MNEARMQVDYITDNLKKEMGRFEQEKQEDFKALLIAHARDSAEYARQVSETGMVDGDGLHPPL